MREVIKKIRCKHEYEEIGQEMINCGTGKIFIEGCKKCGKTRRRVF